MIFANTDEDLKIILSEVKKIFKIMKSSEELSDDVINSFISGLVICKDVSKCNGIKYKLSIKEMGWLLNERSKGSIFYNNLYEEEFTMSVYVLQFSKLVHLNETFRKLFIEAFITLFQTCLKECFYCENIVSAQDNMVEDSYTSVAMCINLRSVDTMIFLSIDNPSKV